MNVRLGCHDDQTHDQRTQWRKRGAIISEFPETLDAALAAKSNGNWVALGAPNLFRGGAHNGNVNAFELVMMGYCDALAFAQIWWFWTVRITLQQPSVVAASVICLVTLPRGSFWRLRLNYSLLTGIFNVMLPAASVGTSPARILTCKDGIISFGIASCASRSSRIFTNSVRVALPPTWILAVFCSPTVVSHAIERPLGP